MSLVKEPYITPKETANAPSLLQAESARQRELQEQELAQASGVQVCR